MRSLSINRTTMGFQCGAPAANQNARHPAKRKDTLGKGKLRSTVGGAIYANVIWPGMKWKYAIGFNPNVDIWNVVVVDSENGLHAAPNSNSMLQAKYAENICERN